MATSASSDAKPESKLAEYQRKRDFSKTPEPGPAEPTSEEKNLVFVIQQHAATRMHWDFRLEVDGVLKSWPLPKGPSLDPSVKRLAVMTEDHPYEYRTFEGVIPKGEYGGGQVIVWDDGVYTPDEDGVLSWDDREEGSRRMLEGIERGKLSFTLRGHKLHGSFTLVKTKTDWLFIKHRDEFASTRDVLEEDRSVRSGLSIQDLKDGRLPPAPQKDADPFLDPARERPMMATLVEHASDSSGWLWEPKLDGVRVLAFVDAGKAHLRSRSGLDCTKQYPSIARALTQHPNQPFVFDGEICALDDAGVPRFQLLQGRINLSRANDVAQAEAATAVVYYVFDVLYGSGRNLKGLRLAERKGYLKAILAPSAVIRPVAEVEEAGLALEASARTLGMEGVVGKRLDSRYESGVRSRNWLKVKVINEQEFVVGGYTTGEGGRASTFGALAIGYYDDEGKLIHAGNVGSGFDGHMLEVLKPRLDELRTNDKTFANKVEGKTTWVRPELVVQVKFSEWTHDGHLRAPVFLGLRSDIRPDQVHRETAAEMVPDVSAVDGREANPGPALGAAGMATDVALVLEALENPRKDFSLTVQGGRIGLTNLDKVFWPEHAGKPARTKRDMVRYYTRVAPWLLPHLRDRPLTLTRYPNGIHSSLFYQKHYAQPIPEFVDTVQIWSSHNEENGTYIMCNNLPTLVWLAQIADLEVHAWMSRVDPEPDARDKPLAAGGSEAEIDASVLNYPDFMVFDLDPYVYAGHEAKGAEPEFNKAGWSKTVEMALVLKETLDQMRLSSYVKTTGKTGLHVYTPVLRDFDYDDIRKFTADIGRHLVSRYPKDLTMEWDTSKRTDKVFFDHNQNTRGKTLAAEYSLRPTPWAGASMPVTWSELPKVDPIDFNMDTLPDRLAKDGDPWADILAHKTDLSALLGG